MRKRSTKPRLPFEHVEITGSVGVRDEKVDGDGPVKSVDVRGYRGRVCAGNANYVTKEGVPMVGVRLGDTGQGGLIAVPRAALRNARRRNFFSIAGDAWDRIFRGT